MFSSLGRLLGVPTPVADSVNTLLGVVEQRDFYAEGRTVERLGLAGLTVDQVKRFLAEGTIR
jgi:opine dehydrogenase